MNMKKIATMATCMALVGAVAVGGTLALLTKEDSITNTFVVGNGFPVDPDKPTDKDLPFFYVNETVVKMEERTGNWVDDERATPDRSIENQTYGPRDGKPETDNWKVTAGVELLKDPQFYVNHDKVVQGKKEVPEVFVVAKIGTIPTGFEVYTGKNGANWYQVTTSDGGETWTKVEEQLEPNTKLDANTYYIYSEPLDANSATKDDWNTTKLFELVKTNDQVSNDNTNEIEVSGVAVETPVKGATLDKIDLNTVVSAAYKAMN
ncbi:hypothetical protein [Allofournierella massiliensis]|uniref:hypothetical protein n=1 Tax=Allofournierella massiliensis TaxID=1650663 RepID=UPI003565309A